MLKFTVGPLDIGSRGSHMRGHHGERAIAHLSPLRGRMLGKVVALRHRAREAKEAGKPRLTGPVGNLPSLVPRNTEAATGVGVHRGRVLHLIRAPEKGEKFAGRALAHRRGPQLRGAEFLRQRTVGLRPQAGAPLTIDVRMTTHGAFLQLIDHEIQAEQWSANRASLTHDPPCSLIHLGGSRSSKSQGCNIPSPFSIIGRLGIQGEKGASAKGSMR